MKVLAIIMASLLVLFLLGVLLGTWLGRRRS